MPVKTDDFIDVIESTAPLELAYEWDNSGMQIRCSEEINKALITLDVTDKIAKEAKEKNCDMIISHHPLFFECFKSIDHKNVSHAVAIQLIKSGISVYSAHTTYDKAAGGVGDMLALKLGLEGISAESGVGEGLMRTGSLREPLEKNKFLSRVKKALETETLRVSSVNIDKIKKVAVVGGSGGNFSRAAKEAGAQALLTGEAKHHHFIEAAANGILLVEAGHFETEKCFVEGVFMSLQSRVNTLQLDVEIIKADNVQPLYEYI
jgi:dinuclear metal center YbgI/SA1388 family protein